MTKQCFYLIISLLLLSSCGLDKKRFESLDVKKSGIQFENKLTPTEDFNIIDYLYFYNGGGVSIGDINNDSLPDIFFSGNQLKNKLYLNKGNLQFEDITEKAGVEGNSTWNTGSSMADVNGDGLLDIYVCAVVGFKNLMGHNELYINNGDNTFDERSSEFGLDYESYSSTAAFLDYDLDGDLDMYLLNHAVHTSESFGHANLRNKRTYETGDKLLRNDGNKFIDVSEEAHIYGGVNGYGLGISVADFNQDGFPDIYIGNDFHEDDYYYLNNGDGTFSEKGKDAFTLFSRFSMGNDASDINHDGLPDLISLDMLSDDELILKRSEGDENITTLKMRTKNYGYHYQFSRNMLQINRPNGKFSETALLSNVAATDWSWSAIFSDFDQDGNQDLFISNGIPKRPNDLDYIKYVSSEQIVNTIGATKVVDQQALSLMPSGKAHNYIYQGTGDIDFIDKSKDWLPNELTCSAATAVGDLDNDGDLDIVVNNTDDKPAIYINNLSKGTNYLKIKLNYTEGNKFGVGSRVFAFSNGLLQLKELFNVRGFQASSEPIIHFGFGAQQVIDSIKVIWPDGSQNKLYNIKTNQTLVIYNKDSKPRQSNSPKKTSNFLFKQIDLAQLGINFKHVEDSYTDFDRLKLLPYQQSDRGPATAIGDLNNDGLLDIYFGGSKRIGGQIYMQDKNGFKKQKISALISDSLIENTEAVIRDFNADNKTDLFIGTGGADFYGKSKPLLDFYYLTNDSSFSLNTVTDYYENASCLKPFDFDADGDVDLFVGNESVSNDFGKIPKSYLLVNERGVFTPVNQNLFEKLGMVTDAIWDDYNKDGYTDLIVIGEWMAPMFLKNIKGVFEQDNFNNSNLSGLWQSISAFDIDGDGDNDYILGNWGLNSKFKASSKYPMKMIYGDIDGNGSSETIIAIAKNGRYYTLDNLDLLASQMPILRKKFLSYQTFAGKDIDEIFESSSLSNSYQFEVQQLASGYLKNDNGQFTFVQFPNSLQLAPIMAQLNYDFDFDEKEEVLLAGNYFGVQPFHGRFGSFAGSLIKNDSDIKDGIMLGLDFIGKSIRHLNVLDVGNKKYLLVTINNDWTQLYELIHEK